MSMPCRIMRPLVLLTMLALWLTLATLVVSAGPPISWSGTPDIMTGGLFDQVVALCDLNGDGNLDLISAVQQSRLIKTYLGAGDGTFAFAAQYASAEDPRDILTADLNRDGHQDVVLADYAQYGTAWVHFGLGDGILGPKQDLPLTMDWHVSAVAAGDLDHDGDVDLVILPQRGYLDVLMNQGDGTFATAIPYGLREAFPGGVAIADMNNDGWPDLAATSMVGSQAYLDVLMNQGDGTFAPRTTYTMGYSYAPLDVVAADLNQDGWHDLAIACAGNADLVAIYLNQGDGSLGPPAVFPGLDTPIDLVCVDINRDGALDLAVVSPDDGIYVLAGTGDGRFSQEPTIALLDTAYAAAGDVNGDGLADLACAHGYGTRVRVMLNTTTVVSPGFRTAQNYGVGAVPFAAALGDMDHDGDLDIVVSNSGDQSLGLMLNDGAGAMSDGGTNGLGAIPRQVALGDMNHDGDLDAVVSLQNAGEIALLLGDGVGGLGAPITATVAAGPIGLALGDLNGDGHLDVVSACESDESLSIRHGDGAGGFGPESLLAAVGGTQEVAIGDLDGDAWLDLVTASRAQDCVYVYLSTQGVFTEPVTYTGVSMPVGIDLADLDNDGHLDVVATNPYSDTFCAMYGDGSGALGACNSVESLGGPGAVVIRDYNRDGVLDLATASFADAAVRVHPGRDSGGFNAPSIYACGGGPADLVAGDLNQDGTLDLVTVNSNSNDLSILLGCPGWYTVVNSDDNGPGSLRQGLAEVCDGSMIYVRLRNYPATISLATGQLAVDKSVTIVGPGADQLTISGNNTYRHFYVSSGALDIRGMTLRDGSGGLAIASLGNDTTLSASATDGGSILAESGTSLTADDIIFRDNAAYMWAGAVLVDGPVTITNASFVNNESVASCPGALKVGGPAVISNTQFIGNRAAAYGGAVVLGSSGVFHGCTFENNHADTSGGAISTPHRCEVTSSRFIANWSGLYGGAISAYGCTIEDSYFERNHAAGSGGAIDVAAGSTIQASQFISNTTFQRGGAVRAGSSLDLDDCLLEGNQATYGGAYGGGAYIGAGGMISNTLVLNNTAGRAGGGLYAFHARPITVVSSTIRGNQVGESGGGIYLDGDGTIIDTQIIGNHAGVSGGGVCGYEDGALIMTRSLLQANSSSRDGGGISLLGGGTISTTTIISNTASSAGGGVFVDNVPITMMDSTVRGNRVGAGSSGSGGGMYFESGGSAYLTNVTLAGNIAAGSSDVGGGAIVYRGGSDCEQLHLTNCTVVGNSTSTGSTFRRYAGGVNMRSGYPAVITNCLIANNTNIIGSPDVSGKFTSGGGNLVGILGDATGLADAINGDQIGSEASPLNPVVGVLGYYGGDTETIPLLPGSPAINMGTGPGAPITDQRGVTRDGSPDVGAFEARPFGLNLASGDGQATMVSTAFADPLLVNVTSTSGDPVDGGVVSFSAPDSGASAWFSAAGLATIAGGQASVAATANQKIGAYQVQASLPGVSPVAFDLENLPPSEETAFSHGPARLCPGHNIYYSLVISNTSTTASISDIVVTGTVPAATEYYGESTTPVAGVYDAGSGVIVWRLDSLAAGDQASFDWTVHTFNGTADGTVIIGGVAWERNGSSGGADTLPSTIDSSLCGPPPADLTISGRVFGGSGVPPTGGANLLTMAPVPGAIVTATTCLPGEWVAVTGAEGAYEIVIPANVAESCDEVTLVVTAQGFMPMSQIASVADLRVNSVRDFWLDPRMYVWLPLGFK